jgi:hypothetical protein
MKESTAKSCTGTPHISMKIDKLSLTLSDYTEKQKFEMMGAALQFMDGGWGQKVFLRTGYKLNIMVRLQSTTERALFSWDPVIKTRPYFRIDFNPSKLGPEAIEQLIYEQIDLVLDFGVPEFHAKAKISRIDIAIDLLGVSIQDLFVFSDQAVRSAKYERFGTLESIYLGSSKSTAQTRIYDKVAEMIAKGQMVESVQPITRIERVVRNAGSLKNLAKMKNHFSTLHLASMSDKANGIPIPIWRMFVSHTQRHTTQAALAQLPKSERAKYKAALKANEPIWWDTAEIWKQWPALIDHLGLIPKGPLHYGKAG